MLRPINLDKPIYKGSHFLWREVWAKSGYPDGKLPFGPTKLLTGKWVLTPRKNAIYHAKNMDELRRRINRLRVIHKLPEIGININSWARSPQHNKEVHGAPDSRHQYFDACDVTVQEIEALCPWPNGRDDFDRVCDTVFAYGGFGTYPAGNRHVDSRGYKARWSDWVKT